MSEAAPAPAKKPSFWRAFAQPAAGTMLFFGFSCGLPFLLVAGTLALWLKDSGLVLDDITMIASAGMLYVLKPLWAPLLDHWRLPGFARLGRRRGWLLFGQLGLVLSLSAMALLTPDHLWPFIAATLLVAFFGATQDIAVDAWRIEIAPLEAQGALVAVYSLGYRIGLMVSFAFALILADHMPWRTVYLLMAAAMLLPIGANLLAREPMLPPPRDLTIDETELRFATGWTRLDRFYNTHILPHSLRAYRRHPWLLQLRNSVIVPLIDLFRRYGIKIASVTILFILIFKIPEQATIAGITSPFYRDMGFSKTEIGAVTKIYGVWIGIAGTFAGGAAVARFGIWRPLLFAIVVCGLCNLLYLLLIAHPGDIAWFTLVISGENFTLGMLGPPTVAYLSSLVNREHTGTQYSLLSALLNMPGKVVGFFAGSIVMATNYATFFALTTLAIPPAVVLCLWLWSQDRRREAG